MIFDQNKLDSGETNDNFCNEHIQEKSKTKMLEPQSQNLRRKRKSEQNENEENTLTKVHCNEINEGRKIHTLCKAHRICNSATNTIGCSKNVDTFGTPFPRIKMFGIN